MKHGLGRIPSPPDSRDYKMSTILTAQPIPASKYWPGSPILNQKLTPHCVGFGWAGWGISVPVNTKYTDDDGHAIYRSAKVFDGEPLAENGSTVRSGAKAMIKKGRIKGYYFATTFYEAKEFVGNHGPVVIGVDWYEGMNAPDKYSIIRPTGVKRGGHCLLWVGLEDKWGILRNSWGDDWGEDGECRIQLNDLALLLAANGEACAAIEKPYVTAKTPSLWDRIVNKLRG